MKVLFLFSIILHMQTKLPERQVLLFYSETGKALLEKQRKEFLHSEAGMKERDITIKEYQVGLANETTMKAWKVDKGSNFTFLLVGRDGGEKFRSTEFVASERLFAIIDAMPMRKNEKGRSR